MANLWINIVKPKGIHAKWLIFLTLTLLLAFGALGHFDIVREYLDTEALTFKAGAFEISAYRALKSILIVVLIFWLAAIVSDFAEKRIGEFKKIRAANRALILKIVHIGIYIIAALFALDIVGIDLTTLTVFSGALGIGLGFGLQKIASNFISGLILLFEKSVEQDDLIELSDGTFGFVRKANARYTLIETFDSREILVPNEDLITNRVVNWTLTNTKGRIEIAIGVSYDSDIEKALELILESAQEHPRCINDPEPKCYLRNFGESSVDMILHFWVADVAEGRWVPHSEVMLSIWRKFHEHNIQIPYPQRDLHIKSSEIIKVNNHA